MSVTRTVAALLGIALSACGGVGQPAAEPTSPPASDRSSSLASPTATSEPSATATPEPVAVLEPSTSFDLGQGLGLVHEDGDTIYVQVESGVVRVDRRSGEFEQLFDGLEPPWGLNIGFGSAWVSTDPPGTGVIDRYDLATGELIASIEVGKNPVETLTAFDSIWVPNDHSGTVSRIDPTTNEVVATIKVVDTPSGGPVHVSAGAGRVWAASPRSNRVSGIDPATNAVVLEITAPEIPCGTNVAAGRVWIGRCTNGPRTTWVHDAATGDPIGELNALVATNGERTFALTIEPGTRNAIVRAIDPDDLTLSDPIAWPGIPGHVFVGPDTVWITSGTQLLGYSLESLPAP